MNKIYRLIRMLLRIPRLMWAIARLIFSRINNRSPQAIGLVVDYFGYGGLEQVVLDLYGGYRAHNYPTYIISVTDQVSDLIQSIEDDPRHLRILHYSIIDLIHFCRKNNIRTLHYHFSIFKMPIMRILGFNLLYTIHNTYTWFGKRAWIKTKLYLRFCNHIVAVSDFAKDYFIKKTGIKNVHTIINGIDVAHFTSSVSLPPVSRRSLGFSEKDFVFVNVASFSEQKYQTALIGVMEKIIKSRQDIKVLLVGTVNDKTLYGHFLRVLEKSPARDNIKIIDHVPHDQVSSFLAAVPDALVLPSIYEAGVPLVVMEALASGLPVVMTDLRISETSFLADKIIAFSPPYGDLTQLNNRDIRRITRRKHSINQADIIEKMLYVVDNHSKLIPSLTEEDRHNLSIDKMVEQYIKMISR